MTNYKSKRFLAKIGKAIYEETIDDTTTRKKMPLPEAQYLKNCLLRGLGRRPWSELRRHILKLNAELPSHDKMYVYEESICYKLLDYHGGIRAGLLDILQVWFDL